MLLRESIYLENPAGKGKIIIMVVQYTCRIDLDIAIASTGTTEPIRRPISTGVMTIDDIVVKLVKTMLSATSPLLK